MQFVASLREASQSFSARRRIMGSVSASRTSTLKGVFNRDGLCGPVGNHWTLINTAGEFVQARAIAPKLIFKFGEFQCPQFADSLNPKFRQLLFRDFPDSRYPSNRQRQQERLYFLWLDHEQSIRLPPVRCELGQKFVRCHSGRGSQIQFLPDLFTDGFCYKRRCRQPCLVFRDVEVRFVERQAARSSRYGV